jgi:hypothetical protein
MIKMFFFLSYKNRDHHLLTTFNELYLNQLMKYHLSYIFFLNKMNDILSTYFKKGIKP